MNGPEREPGRRLDRRLREVSAPVLDWGRALVLGLRDTFGDILDEGRRGAREASDRQWRRFDRKTKGRRKPRT